LKENDDRYVTSDVASAEEDLDVEVQEEEKSKENNVTESDSDLASAEKETGVLGIIILCISIVFFTVLAFILKLTCYTISLLPTN